MNTARQLRFVISGGGAALAFFVLGWGFVAAGLSPFAATTLAYLIAFALAYSAQQFWTFAASRPLSTSLPRYLALQMGCGLLAASLSQATATLGLRPMLMSLATTLAVGALSYVVSARWVFPPPAARTR